MEDRSTVLGGLDTPADERLVSGVLVDLVSVGRASAWIASTIIGGQIEITGLRGERAMEARL